MGRCPECGKWDTLVEETQTFQHIQTGPKILAAVQSKPVPIDSVELKIESRLLTGIKEFDRVLGGGLVAGTLVLIGGEPGIGKSTLMLQVLYGLAESEKKVLYISGEESIPQIRIRSQRLLTDSPHILVVSEVDLESILAMFDSVKPDVIVIDSSRPCLTAISLPLPEA